MKRSKVPSFIIVRDTQEQLPYSFSFARGDPDRWTRFRVTRKRLVTGDYATTRTGVLVEPTTPVAEVATVERKSLSDLYATLSGRREQFLEEMQRMSRYGYACVVVEAPMESIYDPNAIFCRFIKLNPRSVIATFVATSQRFGVHFWTLPHRHGAEQFTFRILERWYLDGINDSGRATGLRSSDLQGTAASWASH